MIKIFCDICSAEISLDAVGVNLLRTTMVTSSLKGEIVIPAPDGSQHAVTVTASFAHKDRSSPSHFCDTCMASALCEMSSNPASIHGGWAVSGTRGAR